MSNTPRKVGRPRIRAESDPYGHIPIPTEILDQIRKKYFQAMAVSTEKAIPFSTWCAQQILRP